MTAKGTLRKRRRKKLYNLLSANGSEVLCYVCGKPVSRKDATLEHIIPLSKGGTDKWENLQISHDACNQLKGNT